jgi:hypothetical protein
MQTGGSDKRLISVGNAACTRQKRILIDKYEGKISLRLLGKRPYRTATLETNWVLFSFILSTTGLPRIC